MTTQAAYYNHQGIQLLSQGNPVNALGMFKEASRLLQTAGRRNCGIRGESASMQQCMYEHVEDEDVERSQADQEIDNPTRAIESPCRAPLSFPRIDVDGCFMVCTPLEIPSTSENLLSSAAAIVLFNMALTYHLLPVIASQRLDAQRHALLLYNMAYNLAISDIENETCSRLTIVTLLNMALIEKERGNNEEAERCLFDLTEYVTALETESSGQEIVSRQRNEFLCKATMLLRMSLGAAAA
jgi:tetratricopeptide (TPR) repeat protein